MKSFGVGNYCAAVAALVFAVLAAMVMLSTSVHATASDPRMFISGDNTFYAYAKGGETIDVSFTRSSFSDEGGLAPADVTTSIEGPALPAQTCALPKSIPVGQGCRFDKITAPQSGIYKIRFALPDSASAFEQVSPKVRWGGNLFSWNITVNDGKSEKKGRVWSELYAIRQPVAQSYLADLSYYYVSESGYVYRGVYKGYNGQISTLSADAVGIRKNDTCESAYQSIDVGSTTMSPSFGTCGGSYKIFFEQPSGDLPQKAITVDKRSEWVLPDIARPTLSDLKFTSGNDSTRQSGKITFTLKDFVGQYKVRVDTDNDGNYDGRGDVKFARTLEKQTDAVQSIDFSGLNGTSQPIPATQEIGVKIEIEKTAEIHLVSSDVEGRVGGLELTRLNGDNAPTTRMCWDDRNLAELSDITLQTSDVDGKECPDSVGGVHGWAYATGSWGDMRYIDDWAYAKANVVGSNEVKSSLDNDKVSLINRRNTSSLLAVIVGSILLGICAALEIVVLVKRRKHKALLEQAIHRNDAFRPPDENNDKNSYNYKK